MAAIGVLVPPYTGHLNPMNALCRELQRRGHQVVVASPPDSERSVTAAGLDFLPIGADEAPVGSVNRFLNELSRLSKWRQLRLGIPQAIRDAELMLRDGPPGLRRLGVELLVVDQFSLMGSTVAELLDVPFVSIANALLFNRENSLPPIRTSWNYDPNPSRLALLRNRAAYEFVLRLAVPFWRAIDARRAALGLAPVREFQRTFSPWAQISQQPPEFEFPRKSLPKGFHFAGPFVDSEGRAPISFPYDALDGRPLVYASLGTIQNNQLRIFQKIAEACAGLDVQLVISMGGSADPSRLGALPGDPIVVRYAPQLELLRMARLAITHAGLNTTLEALSQGVPLVAIPIAHDQPGVASRVVWTGSGLSVLPSQITAERLREAISRVLTEPGFRSAAGRLRDAIQRSGGVVSAADVVERVLAATEASVPVLQ